MLQGSENRVNTGQGVVGFSGAFNQAGGVGEQLKARDVQSQVGVIGQQLYLAQCV